jgi:hypothetical protein
VTVTVRASAWRGTSELERYATPFHVVVQNDTSTQVSFGLQDLALFDEGRTQFNALAPERIVRIIQGDRAGTLAYSPHFTPAFGVGRRLSFSYPFVDLQDPFFFRWWYVPPAAPPRADDVMTQAFSPGMVRPNARVQGFVYFKKLPPEARGVVLQVRFEVQGEPGHHQEHLECDPPLRRAQRRRCARRPGLGLRERDTPLLDRLY